MEHSSQRDAGRLHKRPSDHEHAQSESFHIQLSHRDQLQRWLIAVTTRLCAPRLHIAFTSRC